MNGSLLPVACLVAAVALLVPAHPRIRREPRVPPSPRADGWMRRWRGLLALLSGAAAATFLSAPLMWVAAPAAAVAVWLVIGRAEEPGARREREDARRDLPHVVGLLGDALRSGQAPGEALALVAGALPGAASDRLGTVVPRLLLGADQATVWAALSDDPALAPLGRTLERAHSTGASVVSAVERLAVLLADDSRGEVEDRARAVGVKAALPLGLCLLPSFVLLGIVPVAAGMLGALGW